MCASGTSGSRPWRAAGIAAACLLAGTALLLVRGEVPRRSTSGIGARTSAATTMPSGQPGGSPGMDMSSMPGMEGMPGMPDMAGVTQLAAPREGQPLPELRLVDVQGREISREQLRGHVVLLDVWASWCGPCKQEMPEFQKLANRYASRGLLVIGVSIDMTAEDASQFARSIGVTYPIVHHPQIMSEWGLLGLPTTFVLDRAGVVRRMVIGFEYPDSFEKTIRELL